MSSDEQPIIRNRRRRALDTADPQVTPEPKAPDVFDPGPMVEYPPLPVDANGLPLAPAVRHRVRELRRLNRFAAQDFILRTLHTYLLAHRPTDEIARSFGVSLTIIYKWRKELYARIGHELKKKTPTDLISRQIAELEHVKATAWQGLYKTGDHGEKNRYLNTVVTTEKAIADLYARVGMIGASTMAPALDPTVEDTDGRAGALTALAKEFLTGGYAKGKKKETKTIEQDISTPIDDNDYLL